MPITPFAGFAPDLDPQTPGILLDTDKVYPTRKGFRPTRAPVALFNPLGEQVVGGYRARYLDGTERLFAGTLTTLNEGRVPNWTDRSGMQTFAATADHPWRFANFGNHVIATNGVDVPQVSTDFGEDFVPLGGDPPIASIVETVQNFVFFLNTTGDPPTTQANQWWCSALGNDQDYVPSAATQSANGILAETYGDITAGKRLGADLVVYKLRSMYVAQYVGPRVIWAFSVVSDETGAPGQESVVAMADRHVFPGFNDFYMFNGSRPQPLESPLREWFFQTSLDQNYSHRIIGRWDKANGVVVWHYPSINSAVAGRLDRWLAWHVETNRWTTGTREIEWALQSEIPLTAGIAYDDLQTEGIFPGSYNDGPNDPLKTYDTLTPQESKIGFQAIFTTDHILRTLTGAAEPSYLLTGDYGDDYKWAYLIRVKPRFSLYPQRGTIETEITYANLGDCYKTYADLTNTTTYGSGLLVCEEDAGDPLLFNFYRLNLGDTESADQVVRLATQGWYNLRRRARFHRFKLTFPGDYEILGIEPVLQERGRR